MYFWYCLLVISSSSTMMRVWGARLHTHMAPRLKWYVRNYVFCSFPSSWLPVGPRLCRQWLRRCRYSLFLFHPLSGRHPSSLSLSTGVVSTTSGFPVSPEQPLTLGITELLRFTLCALACWKPQKSSLVCHSSTSS